jgi:hypothetical protein
MEILSRWKRTILKRTWRALLSYLNKSSDFAQDFCERFQLFRRATVGQYDRFLWSRELECLFRKKVKVRFAESAKPLHRFRILVFKASKIEGEIASDEFHERVLPG